MSKPAVPDDVARAIDEPVKLADYDPEWPGMFEAERRRLMEVLPGTFIEIEHIGSTAVEGMRAKPLIDLLAGVATMDDAFAINNVLDRIGYTTSPTLNSSLKTRQWFMRQSGGRRTHHLHVVVHDDHEWWVRVRFRDRLRKEPAIREQYEALKNDLVKRYANDRDSYTEGKSTFIKAAANDKEDE